MTGWIEFLAALGQLLRDLDSGFFPVHFRERYMMTADAGGPTVTFRPLTLEPTGV